MDNLETILSGIFFIWAMAWCLIALILANYTSDIFIPLMLLSIWGWLGGIYMKI